MSIQAVAWVLEHSKSKGTARLVLIALANRVGREDGECWPSMRTVASDAGVASPSTVKDAVERLEALGEVIILEKGNARRSGKYRLPFAVANGRSGGCSPPEHPGARPANAASSPERTQRSAQTEQNRNEPSGTKRRAVAERPAALVKDFDEQIWPGYPRKEARLDALDAYIARRREGVEAAELARSVPIFARAMRADGRTKQRIMHGATFFGPHERWRDYLTDVPPERPGRPEEPAPRPAPDKVGRCERCGDLSVDCRCPGGPT